MNGQDIGPILLKLRFLASRFGSNNSLEKWVKYETEGYSKDVDLPDYRKVFVSYRGTFTGAFGAAIRNAPIPSAIISEFAGDSWNRKEMRESIAAIGDLIAAGKDGILHIVASNLIFAIQGNMYDGYACNEVIGLISTASLAEIQNVVRAKVLELTIELEKAIPEIVEIGIGQKAESSTSKESESAANIINNIVHGNLTNISNSGDSAQFHMNINQGNVGDLVEALDVAGLGSSDSHDLAKLMKSENPDSRSEPFGPKAKEWILKNIGKAADGTWKVGISTATKLITEAALKFYGFS